MGTLPVVENPDVLKDRFLCFFTGFEMLLVQPFLLELSPEAFHWRVIPAVALSAHAADEAACPQEILVAPRAILRPSI